MPRQFRPGQFIRATVGPALAAESRTGEGIVLGIDECLNDPEFVAPMVERLVRSGVIERARPLWYEARILGDGTRVNFLGGVDRNTRSQHELGRPPRPASRWPDEGVVAQLVSHFVRHDRLCLLTKNTKNDRAGLKRILHDEVRPVLEALSPNRLGLLALVQRPGTSLSTYCAAVEGWLSCSAVERGFHWMEVPQDGA